MKRLACFLALVGALVLGPAQAATPPGSESAAAAQQRRIAQISAQLHPVTGDVGVPGANAVLHLGSDYYFLPANEARLVLTDGWGNPPEVAEGVLGLVFPAGRTFADDTWGAVVSYEATGYVSDSDARSADYAALMRDMQGAEERINAERTRQGYPAQHLVGWAQTPVYDSRAHSVVWARNIQFPDSRDNSLNYDIRLLGRQGVLSLNMVTVMSKLNETRAAAARFAQSAEFNPGERYADFQAGRDRVAEYGVTGLIAGGVGLAVAKKAGLLAIILAFGKKIIIFLIAGVAMLWRRIKNLFGGRDEEEAPVYYEEAPAEPEAGGALLTIEPAAEAGPQPDEPPNPVTT